MANFFDVLPEAASEAMQISNAEKGTNLVRLSAIITACDEGCRNGFKLEAGGALEDVPLNDGTDQVLSVRILKYPETTVAGIVAIEQHGDDTESGRLLAVGTYTNGHELTQIYRRGLSRLKSWVAKHGTLRKVGDKP